MRRQLDDYGESIIRGRQILAARRRRAFKRFALFLMICLLPILIVEGYERHQATVKWNTYKAVAEAHRTFNNELESNIRNLRTSLLLVQDNDPAHCYVHSFTDTFLGRRAPCDKNWHPYKLRRPYPTRESIFALLGDPDRVNANGTAVWERFDCYDPSSYCRIDADTSLNALNDKTEWLWVHFNGRDGRLDWIDFGSDHIGRTYENYARSPYRRP